MKKLLFILLLISGSIYAQTDTGEEQVFDYGIKNNAAQTVTSAAYITTTSATGTQGKILPANLPVSTQTQIAIDGKVSDTIRNGINSIAPSENAVHDALQEIDLQSSYDKGNLITTSTGLGALTIKRGSSADTDNVLVVQNGSGSDTFLVKGNGDTAVFGLLSGFNGNFSSSMQAASFNLPGGTSSQFLKADGSVDSNVYATNSSVVHLSGTETISGNKTFSDKINIGSGFSADDSAILIHRNLTGGLGATGAHGSRDETQWLSNSGTGLNGYASYDAIPVVSGSAAFNHIHGYQSRPEFNGNTTIGGIRGFTYQGTFNSGTIDYSDGMLLYDYIGSGTVNNNVGLRIQPLTKGISNFSIFTEGSTPSFFGGALQSGGIVTGTGLKINTLTGTYGQVTSLDADGNILGNPNITIINGVLDMKASTAEIKSSAIDLRLNSVYGIFFKANGSDRMELNASGNLLLNAVDNGSKLRVNGTGWFDGSLTATTYSGGATLTGTPTAPTATAGTNTTQIATTAFVQAQASGGNYTPTLTNTANITSSSLTNATYTRIGDIVTVNIGFSVDPTAANTNTVLTITLPIARTVSTVLNSGSGAIFQSNTRLPASFQTSGNTTQGVIYMYPSSTGTYAGSVTFQYNIN